MFRSKILYSSSVVASWYSVVEQSKAKASSYVLAPNLVNVFTHEESFQC